VVALDRLLDFGSLDDPAVMAELLMGGPLEE
jgi:hypothetical protein